MTEKKVPFIEVKNLVVHYTSEGREIHAVNDVSFFFGKRENAGTGWGNRSGKDHYCQIHSAYIAGAAGPCRWRGNLSGGEKSSGAS